ncbi:hypothetical protein ABT324_27110 [Saccharopolyspora sp. NPDC000359]|uniref:hypothetical protein n=1 Tax=Saccharopolyspora sp. NPDC000359 TaxID=3154251 RepID=UPI00332FB5A6
MCGTASCGATRGSARGRALRRWVVTISALVAVAACADAPAPPPPDRGVPDQRVASMGTTLPPEQPLPTGAECAQHVPRTGREQRPANAAANSSTPGPVSLPAWHDFWDPRVNTEYVPRIDGNFTGTTDEILWWGACKWGFDVDFVRAMAAAETSWYQHKVGDYEQDPKHCAAGYQAPCPTSFGILQIKHYFRPGSYPASQRHTAFNVDYALAGLRGCFQGWVTYLADGYRPGDLWGCAGWHYSGEWKTPPALGYISRVQAQLKQKPWLTW